MSDTTNTKSKDRKKRAKFWSLGFRRSRSEAKLMAQAKAKSEAPESSTTTTNTKPMEANLDFSESPVAGVVEGQAGVEVNPSVQASAPPSEEKKKQMEDEKLLAEIEEFAREMEAEKLLAEEEEEFGKEIEALLKMETDLQEAYLAKMRQQFHKIKQERESGIGWVGVGTGRPPKNSSTIRAAIKSAPRA